MTVMKTIVVIHIITRLSLAVLNMMIVEIAHNAMHIQFQIQIFKNVFVLGTIRYKQNKWKVVITQHMNLSWILILIILVVLIFRQVSMCPAINFYLSSLRMIKLLQLIKIKPINFNADLIDQIVQMVTRQMVIVPASRFSTCLRTSSITSSRTISSLLFNIHT